MKRGCITAIFSIALTFSVSLNVFADSVLSGGMASISAWSYSSTSTEGSAISNENAVGNT